MNQVKAKFSIVDDGEGLDIDIEGTRMDIIIALATLLHENEEVKMMFETAFTLVEEYKAKETSDEDIVAMLSKIKPIAQA
jgi:hypothetical protein